jgi:hypothetical protein
MTVPPVAALHYAPAPRKTTPRNRCTISRGPRVADPISPEPALRARRCLAKDGSS